MKFFERSHVFHSDWETVTAAWFVKYPNAQSSHVKEIHTFDKESLDVSKFSLRRLFYLEYQIPAWVQRFFRTRMEGYAIEEVTVNRDPPSLTAVGRNITFSSFFQMEEVINYVPEKENPNCTLFTQRIQFNVLGFGPLGRKLETAARDSAEGKSSQGVSIMTNVIDRLRASDWRSPASASSDGSTEPGKSGKWRTKAENVVDDVKHEMMNSVSLHPQENPLVDS
jgi:PRELI-like family